MIIFITILSLSELGIFYSLDKKAQNVFYSFLQTRISNDIIIAEIDEKTVAKLGRFPFDRTTYVPFIKNLTDSGVGVIAFDIIFADKTTKESDNDFASALEQAKNVVFGISIASNGLVERPLEIFEKHIVGLGFFLPNIDKKSNTVYSLRPSEQFGGQLYNHFSIAILKAYYNFIYGNKYKHFESFVKDNKFYITPNVHIPLARKQQNEMLIHYAQRNTSKHFSRVSFIDVYDKQSFTTWQKTESFQENVKTLKNKIVIVGSTVKGIKDIFETPFGTEYGVYTHANMVNTVLTKGFLVYLNKHIEWVLIFFLIVLSVYFNLSGSGRILILSNFVIVTIFLILFPLMLILFADLVINYIAELSFALTLSLTSSNVIKYFIENNNKIKLNKALSEYVSENVAHEILFEEGKVNLDGENKYIAIYFSDIQGFTSISEKFSPEVLVSFLREYLSKMSDIILDKKGFINKYEGDAIMALWGVFGEADHSSYYACLCAIRQQQLLKILNNDWIKRGFNEVKVTVGLHIGDAIIGNIGSKGRKMEFTALGDNINIASRIEGVNKFYGTCICVSGDIYEEVKESFEFRYLDKIRVKGKEIGIKIYELIEEKGKISSQQKDIFHQFSIGINWYLERNFKKALTLFKNLEKLGDKPSTTYKLRCEMYIKNPPDENWDQIWTMDSK